MFNLKSILSVLIVIIALILSIYNKSVIKFFNGVFSSPNKSTTKANLFTPSQLKRFNGDDNPELYLSILGNVFDVTKGDKHYGPGKVYNVFTGRDASRSFVTGKFDEEDLSDDVTDLSNEDLRALHHWVHFYKKEYVKVGKLIGRYYDENGKPTPYNKEVKKLITAAGNEKEVEALEKLKFPPCNAEWNVDQGSRVWCTRRSGGIERDWVGVPRKLYEPGSETYRCACVSDENRHLGNIKEYEGCNPDFHSCHVRE